MTTLRSLRGLAVLSILAIGISVPGATAQTASRDQAMTVQLRSAVASLRVARETRAGYDRAKFSDWIDADGDCRDTRDEVLAAESLVAVRGCDVQVGKWRSYYDGVVTHRSTTFDIDHLVPLAEVWDSGGRRWTGDTRARYANDLGDARTLVAVTASSNRSKGDQDPAEWMPQLAGCKYIQQWVVVKLRWGLTVDVAEKRFLTARAASCANTTLAVRRARVAFRS